jgi:O-methyltransferase
VPIRLPRISQLPRPLRPPARFVRDMIQPRYLFQADGYATVHYSPFMDDAGFNSRFAQVVDTWPTSPDIRWRLWILTRSAIHCANLDGSFAEFGVFRGGCSFMVMSECQPRAGRSYYLFDTFSGIPHEKLTEYEKGTGLGGRLANTSVGEVEERLASWRDLIKIVQGDVFETLKTIETGPLAFVHLDLNAAAPSEVALEYSYDRLVPGGIAVFDDYGWAEFEAQRKVIDRYFKGRKDGLIALPTGQAISVKA